MLISIEVKYPCVSEIDGGVRVIALLGEIFEAIDKHPCARRPGELNGAVSRSRIEHDDIQARVREVLMHRLEKMEPSQEEVAEQLHMSPRTLQRRLGDSGTTYKEVLDKTRHALAMAYLSAPQHSVSDVTYLLGFSCDSSFTRAFRRWTGQSPSHWRSSIVRTAAPAAAVITGVD